MNRITLRRVAISALAAPAIALSAPTLAMADSAFEMEKTAAGPHGAVSVEVESFAGEGDHKNGVAVYHLEKQAAGKDGAFSYSSTSAAY